MINNESFNNASIALGMRHVANHEFMLKLNNVSLSTIEDFSDLAAENIVAVRKECKDNFWYFARTLVKVPVQNANPRQYSLASTSLEQMWCSINKINSYTVTKPEKYKELELDTCVILAWELIFNNTPIVINNRFTEGYKLFQTLKSIISLLPEVLTHELEFTADLQIKRNNVVICHVSEYSIAKQNIELIRRENHNKISVYPDFEYMPISTDLINGFDDEGYDIIISRPGDGNTLSYRGSLDMISKSCKWEDLLYELTKEMEYNYIHGHSKSNFVYIGYAYIGPDRIQSLTYITGPQGPKGDKGDVGPQGPKGDKGEMGRNGYTPVRGVDYWTQEEIQQIMTIIAEHVLRQVRP